MGELQPCLMQGELFLGQGLVVHFHLTAGWAGDLFLLLCAHSGLSVATQGQAGTDKLLVGVMAIAASVAEPCLRASVLMPRGQVGSKGHGVEITASV